MARAQRASTPRNLYAISIRVNSPSATTHIWIAKAWNWHKEESLPAEIPSCAIKDAIFIPRLLHDAAKTSRLMGLLKPLANRNVDKMKNMPSSEKMEVIRSVIAKELSWPGVNAAGVVGDILFNCSIALAVGLLVCVNTATGRNTFL